MIGPVFFEEQDVEQVLALRRRNPALTRVLDTIQSARASRPTRMQQGADRGYAWSRLLDEPSPIAFHPRKGHSLNLMSRMVHRWAQWHRVRVAGRQIDGALHVWLVSTRRDPR